ncbi:MAG: hemerythrin domain-containing protein [Planctomycetota bacterium]
MQARGMLMIEHRLIERMIAQIRDALERIGAGERIDPAFVDTAVDFIRVYADRTHHGKEEDILFRDLEGRSLSDEDDRLMRELIDEHAFGRMTTKALVEANDRYRNGEDGALVHVADHLKALVDFYPKHIEKEDKTFFPASREYISDAEDAEMIQAFQDFDRKMIHERYEAIIERLEG